MRKAGAPQKTWACGFEKKRTLAAFAHAHFLSHPEQMRRAGGHERRGGEAEGAAPPEACWMRGFPAALTRWTRRRCCAFWRRRSPSGSSMRRIRMPCASRKASGPVPRSHIIAMQGPFSTQLNDALYAQLQIAVMVTKDSGEAEA